MCIGWPFFANESLHFWKIQFFRSAGYIVQQIKKWPDRPSNLHLIMLVGRFKGSWNGVQCVHGSNYDLLIPALSSIKCSFPAFSFWCYHLGHYSLQLSPERITMASVQIICICQNCSWPLEILHKIVQNLQWYYIFDWIAWILCKWVFYDKCFMWIAYCNFNSI